MISKLGERQQKELKSIQGNKSGEVSHPQSSENQQVTDDELFRQLGSKIRVNKRD
jgi:hypothetical protein